MSARKSIFEIIKTDEKFSIMQLLLEKTNLAKEFRQGQKIYTFFAPTDGAFYWVYQQAAQTGLADFEKVLAESILNRHLIPEERLYTEDLRRRRFITNLDGAELPISTDESRIFIDSAQILTPAIEARNGIVFAIDKVLLFNEKHALL